MNIKRTFFQFDSRQFGFPDMSSSPNPQPDADQLEAAVDQAIAACDGDAREAIKALIVANAFLEPSWRNCGLRPGRAMRAASCCSVIARIGMTKLAKDRSAPTATGRHEEGWVLAGLDQVNSADSPVVDRPICSVRGIAQKNVRDKK